MPSVTPFEDSRDTPAVRGFLHTPAAPSGDGLVLTHGAGSNAGAPLLVAVADALAASGITVLRCDLPFRQARPHGPPFPAMAPQDRAGLARAVLLLRSRVSARVFLGGHSYGGRQASMLAAEQPERAAGLLLLSYPLHPPRRPADLRTAHFPQLATPALFVHGTRDPFGSIEEMRAALELIRAPHELAAIDGAGHDLGGKRSGAPVAEIALRIFRR
ncbi:MAG TPA: alpha/beta family hydrolase [Bryobacteraceae bacterium]|nr:alpha/beta family hydrolase [Bryobacteraceae bacterium]